ncbi:MAG: DUF5591 domain-containing protein [bacterium]
MLEVRATDGRGRLGDWMPDGKGGRSAAFPGLIVPDTSLAAAPAWATATLTLRARKDPGRIELLSGGTWFYPNAATDGLVVPAIIPAPTTTVQTIQVGTDLAVLHDAAGWASNPKNLVPALIQSRREATPARLLWAPGLGTPEDYALWVYLGVELFDASPLLLAGARGQVLTTDGTLAVADAQRILGDGTAWDQTRIVAHNFEAARQELERIRDAIATGTLRALVERRIYSKAASVEVLRRFDRDHTYLEAAAPRHRTTPLPAMTMDSLSMPEVEAFRRRLRTTYQPPRSAKILVLLPCSQRKPYKTSRSHRQFARVLDESGIRGLLHEVMVTSPLGLVPRELEEVYPANQYDIPVTGHWTRDEEAIVKEQLAALLSAHDYDHVVVHCGQATFDILRHLLPEHTRHTCLHHPTSQEDLARLAAELARIKREVGGVDSWSAGKARKLEDLRALATFQFNAAVADELLDGAVAHGRMPFVKLERHGLQVGMTTPDRGVLSLTLDGAQVLAMHKTHRVNIGDFRPKGTSSLFAIGVESADPDIRVGDEVVVVHNDEVRACGVATMSSEEMAHMERGIAVVLRHTATPVKADKPATQEVAA